jgi:hypothetical protein
MIAFDLVCAPNDHRFEGWFASSAEYDRQLGANLLCCPVCGTAAVAKAVMAPNIGRKGNQLAAPGAKREEEQTVAVSNQPEMPAEIAKAIAELGKLQSKMLENSAWVGDKFAEEARSIHYGEQPERIIHGEATPQQAQALFDEGVSVAPLPLPYVPPEAKN